MPPPPRICVVGLGKLGAPIAAALASRGFEVVGVDTDPLKVAAINALHAPVFEPGLGELLRLVEGRLRATADLAVAVRETDLSLVIVPTPSDPDGTFSLRHLLPACRTIGAALRNRDPYSQPHTVVITSTVMPGATAGPIREALEQASGKRCGEGFGLCYSPEFVALGSVVRDFLHPDFILVGEADPRSGDPLEAMYRRLHGSAIPIARMGLVNAELAKIAVNTFVTTKITFANMLAGLCERLPGADVDTVTAALGLDSRIGKKYLRGAVGYGGPCFPRDNAAIAALARRLGASATLAEGVDRANRQQAPRLAETVRGRLSPGGRVGVLGLSYKPDTDVAEQSQGVMLAELLADEGIAVSVYDPAAMANARTKLGDRVAYACSAFACVAESDVVVIVTPWAEFGAIEAAAVARAGTPRVVIDCWRRLDAARFAGVCEYVAVGVGPREDEGARAKQVA